MQLSRPTNVASVVVHQAMGKALDRFNRAMSREQQLLQQQEEDEEQCLQQQQQGPGELSYEELTVGDRTQQHVMKPVQMVVSSCSFLRVCLSQLGIKHCLRPPFSTNIM